MRKEPRRATTRITLLLVIGLMTLAPLRRAHAGHVTETIVAPVSITDQVGTHTGSVSVLATKDQTGTKVDLTKSVKFGTPPGSSYQGYLAYSLPTSVNRSQITTLTFIGNVFEPDVMIGAGNKTGFSISCATQLAYNLNVAADAHAENMSVAAKDLGYACSDPTYELNNQQVVAAFDFVVDEQCWQYNFCQDYNTGTYNFYGAGKSIFNGEYPLDPSKFCPQANADNFNSIKKAKNQSVLDLPYEPCR